MAKNLFIPPLGTEITLAEDWSFELYNEYRNSSLAALFGIKYPELKTYYGQSDQHVTVTIPKGETLKIDRIYIRKGQSGFDSVTFMWRGKALSGSTGSYTQWDTGRIITYKIPKKPVRFWAKLDDANKIMIEG